MPILFILTIVVQVGLVVHVIKTGRSFLWMWVMIPPGIGIFGCLAYVLVEILPELLRSRNAQRAKRGLNKMLDPTAELRKYEHEARVGGNVASLQRYAEELTRQGRFDDAITEFRKALTGLYEHDPNLMLGIARAQFEKGDAAAARTTLDDLIRLNPDFRSPEGHLLYARSLEAEGNFAKALEEYKALEHSYPGAEAATRYALLLKAQGQDEESRRVARELLEQARIAPAHYRRAQKSWLDQAQRLTGR